MDITNSYATPSQYRSVVGKTDTAQDGDIQTDLTAISRFLEGKMGRFFTKDDSAVERVYVPHDNVTAIWVDDLAETPTAVKLDTGGDGQFATTLESTDFELLPLNADKGPEPRPFMQIGMTPWGNYGYFQKKVRVQVTAKFGWPSVPDAIQRATIQLTAILRLETPRATRRIAELGDVMEASPDAMSIIKQLTDRYKRVRYI